MLQRDQHGPARVTVPGGPQDGLGLQAVGLDERGDRLRTDPDHPGRPQERAGQVVDLVARELDAADHLADRTGLRRGGQSVRGLAPRQGLGDGAIGVRRHDHDRQGAAGPGEIDQASDAGLPEVSARAPSAVADRITAATVMR